MSQPSAYRSIFWEPDWAHQKYYGWRVESDAPGLRVLRKARGPATRALILVDDRGRAGLDAAARREAGRSPIADVIVHDFDRGDAAPETIGGLRFEPISQRERLLNIATVAIDLTAPEEAILARMSGDYRRKIRKAEAAGVTIDAHAPPPDEVRDAFVRAFKGFADERKLKPADSAIVTRMYRAGDAILFVARKGDIVTNYLHLYRAGRNAIFMHGVNVVKENDGAGQYLHWRAMTYIKQLGVEWYDLGGVVGFDTTDGIYNFKRGFGGTDVSLGRELRYRSRMMRMTRAALARLGRLEA